MPDQPRPTPRTEKASFLTQTGTSGTCRVVLAEFSETIEIESDARAEEIKDYEQRLSAAQSEIVEMQVENAKPREALEELDKSKNTAVNKWVARLKIAEDALRQVELHDGRYPQGTCASIARQALAGKEGA
jgi:hypothetical protein